MNVSYSNQAQRVRNCGDGRDEQALVKRAQIKAAIEAIAERCEVTSSVLLEDERLVRTRGRARRRWSAGVPGDGAGQ